MHYLLVHRSSFKLGNLCQHLFLKFCTALNSQRTSSLGCHKFGFLRSCQCQLRSVLDKENSTIMEFKQRDSKKKIPEKYKESESFNCFLPVEEKYWREAMTGLGCLFGTSSSTQQLKQKVQVLFAHGHKP